MSRHASQIFFSPFLFFFFSFFNEAKHERDRFFVLAYIPRVWTRSIGHECANWPVAKIPTVSSIFTNNAATLVARLLRRATPSRLSRFFSLRFCARCRGKMQTIIQGTIGWTRLSLVIGNESSSGRGQSLEIARAPLLPVTLSRIPSKDSSNFYRDPRSERLSLLSTMDRVRS